MKLQMPITKQTVKNHFTYAWWWYVLLIAGAIFGWNLLYTTTHYRSPENLKVEWYYDGAVGEAQKPIDGLMDELHQTLLADMEVVAFVPVTLDQTYGAMQLTVWTSAGQCDLLMLKTADFTSLAAAGAAADLASLAEAGARGLDLQKGNVLLTETGERMLAGIPAEQLPGLSAYGLICEDRVLCVPVTGGNVENALKLLGWLAEHLR